MVGKVGTRSGICQNGWDVWDTWRVHAERYEISCPLYSNSPHPLPHISGLYIYVCITAY